MCACFGFVWLCMCDARVATGADWIGDVRIVWGLEWGRYRGGALGISLCFAIGYVPVLGGW